VTRRAEHEVQLDVIVTPCVSDARLLLTPLAGRAVVAVDQGMVTDLGVGGRGPDLATPLGVARPRWGVVPFVRHVVVDR
jgi:hypothetical protein